jgi:hypothetical protein
MTKITILSAKPVNKEMIEEMTKEIQIARECLDFKGIKCNNPDCLNESCPLNKVYNKNGNE